MPPYTHLSLTSSVHAGMIAHARREAPLECCGLLAGRIAGGVGVASERFEVGNDARSATEYDTNVRDMFTAFRAMRERGLELLAIYHSHPTSAPIPSRRDIENNTYGETAAHVIVGWVTMEPEVRAWWLGEETYREVVLTITDTPRPHHRSVPATSLDHAE